MNRESGDGKTNEACYNDHSRRIIEERTTELIRLNEELRREVAERRKAEKELEQRTQLLATLLDVSNLISSTLELKPLLESILDRLKKIIPYKGARILAVNGDTVKVVAYRNNTSQDSMEKYGSIMDNVPINMDLFRSKKPLVINDIFSEDEIAGIFRKSLGDSIEVIYKNSRCWMGIPLITKDRITGILVVDYDEPGYYRSHHIELGMAFANQVAIEFENARLYNETIKSADEFKTMFAVQQAITSRLDWDYVIQLIADEARRLTSCERTAIFLTEGDDLVISVFSGKDSRRFLGYRLPISGSLMGKALLQGKALTLNNAQQTDGVYEDLVVKANVKSFLSVPLIVGNSAMGTITVVDKTTGDFGYDDERVLSMLASIAVIGLENSRMYQDEQKRHLEDERRRKVAEGLKEVLAVLNSNKPLPEILDFIIGQAVNLLGTQTGALYRLQSDKGILHIEASKGLPEQYVESMMIPVGMGLVGKAVVTRKPIVINDITTTMGSSEYSRAPRKLREPLEWIASNYHGVLAVPLVCKDEIYGGIVLYYNEIKDFSEEEIELAMTFADQTALVIDNARLRAQAEEVAVAAERSRLARDLHDAVTQTLFSSSLIAEVLPKIWEKNPGEGKKRLDELRQLTRGALAEMRTLLLELRPSALIESGLKELLTQLSQAVTGRSRIPIKLTVEGQPALPPDIKIVFYRIAQEALNNIIKHSCATEVSIDLLVSGKTPGKSDCAQLRICDNGRGFEIEKVTPEHLGLGIMKERAEAAGAELIVESCLGEGTAIIINWNLYKGGRENG